MHLQKRTFLSNRTRDHRDRLHIRRSTPLLVRYRQIGLFALGTHNRRSTRYAYATPAPFTQLLNLDCEQGTPSATGLTIGFTAYASTNGVQSTGYTAFGLQSALWPAAS